MGLRRNLPIGTGYSGANLLVSKKKTYSDVDFSFAAKPGTPTELNDLGEFEKFRGDIYKKNEVAAVKQALQNLVLTNHFDKPFQPYFGANLRALLFENIESLDRAEVEDRIRTAIEVWEPRVEVKKIEIFESEDTKLSRAIGGSQVEKFKYDHRRNRNAISVVIGFTIVNMPELNTVSIDLSRLR